MSDISTSDFTTSRISFSSELQPREGEPVLDEEAAAELLARRLGVSRARSAGARFWNTVGQGLDAVNPLSKQAPGDNNRIRDDLESDPTAFDLMVHIVRALPEEYRTQSVLSNLDVRPILAELVITEAQAERMRYAHYVNDVPFAPAERVIAGELLVEQNKVIEDNALVAAAALEQQGAFADADDPSVARQQWIEEATNGWRTADGQLGATPGLINEAIEAETTSEREAAQTQLEQTSLYDQLLIEEGLIDGQQSAFAWLSEEDVQFMFRMNMSDWNAILLNEKNKAQARAAGMTDVPEDLMVDSGGLVGLGTPDTRVDTGSLRGIADASSGRTGQGSTRIRLLDVFNSLYSPQRTSQDLRNLQDKLIAGGYLNEDDIRYWGRATDDATIAAWRTLVRDSINLGRDMNTVLKDSTLAKREEDEEASKAAQRDLVLSSSIGIQSSADVLGQQVIGRSLSGDDHARLIEFIHSLERDQHDTLAPEGGQEAEAIDVDAEVSAWIEREHGVEAGAYDVLEQFNLFNQIARQSG